MGQVVTLVVPGHDLHVSLVVAGVGPLGQLLVREDGEVVGGQLGGGGGHQVQVRVFSDELEQLLERIQTQSVRPEVPDVSHEDGNWVEENYEANKVNTHSHNRF